MKIIRQIAYPLFSVFLLFRTVELIRHLYFSNPIDYGFGESLLIAFLINLFITGVFAFPGFVFPTSRLMPKKYWVPKHPRQLNTLFATLHVNTYKSILVLLFWGKPSNKQKYYSGTRKGLEAFNFQTQQSEFGHLCALVCIVFASVLLLVNGYLLVVWLTTIINFLLNFYPIILQRHHRIRIYQLAEHIGT